MLAGRQATSASRHRSGTPSSNPGRQAMGGRPSRRAGSCRAAPTLAVFHQAPPPPDCQGALRWDRRSASTCGRHRSAVQNSVRPQPRPMKRPLHKVPVGASVHQLSTNSGAQYRAVQIANPTSRANAGGACVRTPLDHSVNGHKLQQSFREGGAYVSTGHIRRDERSRIRSGVSRSGNPRTPRREQALAGHISKARPELPLFPTCSLASAPQTSPLSQNI